MSSGPCDRCCRKIWDPVPAGYMLYCYGHLDNTEGIFVAPERKKSYKVRGCGLFMEHPVRTHTTQPEVPPEILHKRCRGAGSAQSHIEGFFGG